MSWLLETVFVVFAALNHRVYFCKRNNLELRQMDMPQFLLHAASAASSLCCVKAALATVELGWANPVTLGWFGMSAIFVWALKKAEAPVERSIEVRSM